MFLVTRHGEEGEQARCEGPEVDRVAPDLDLSEVQAGDVVAPGRCRCSSPLTCAGGPPGTCIAPRRYPRGCGVGSSPPTTPRPDRSVVARRFRPGRVAPVEIPEDDRGSRILLIGRAAVDDCFGSIEPVLALRLLSRWVSDGEVLALVGSFLAPAVGLAAVGEGSPKAVPSLPSCRTSSAIRSTGGCSPAASGWFGTPTTPRSLPARGRRRWKRGAS